MYSKTLFLNLFYITLLATSAIGAIPQQPGAKATKPKPYPYKQTTRSEVIRRQQRRALGMKRAVPSNIPGPADVSPSTDDTVTYFFFHVSTGAYETDANPSNDVDIFPPLDTTIPGSQDGEEAVQTCADFAWDQGYFAFQVYYRRSTDEWTCMAYIYAYPGDQSDSSYFNVVDDDVALAYGYQQNVE
ncbi:hypothetical protein L486_08492 [Kwoniella mangroviensis CBS 10435]|uniref:Uncharacterized protein n=1 Tax=Kwoniella mangroviensis CBS 10435 TaxID=1331196 RepID=A0A1B9IF02_9TREE|nr:uncharacterized protein I203_08283 [Kwoniella mangroviensis CBS 8507]OCF54014.1 hypothetical protein L486_08492 [Kwoniella mangroviensis CBS 10435]OCF62651.1 hypothetical protein I203_08283 [Kwoniella mangroviensis CBS 8507]OCF70999.1 hypothetical protein I204_08235 [Kwoniella mangroviensis CBS 8886]